MYRRRERESEASATGTIQYGDGGTAQIVKRTKDVVVDDTMGHYGPFEAYKYKIQGSRIIGFEDAWDGRCHFDYPSYFWNRTEHLGTQQLPSELSLATSALAHSNPNKNDMSLPNSLYETVSELPSLIKTSGQIAIDFVKKSVTKKTWASAYLTQQFAISPMVSDVNTLANISKSVNNRLLMLQGLKKYGRISKKKRLGVYKDTGTWVLYLESNRTLLVTEASYDIVTEIWGISEWKLTQPNLSNCFSDQSSFISRMIDVATGMQYGPERIDAFRAATGLAAYDISDLWNILPWSWAVDYFVNIGQVLDANNNSLGLSPTALAICRKWTAAKNHPEVISATGNSRCTAGQMLVTVKSRKPVSISSAQQNFRVFERMLNSTQIANLASLFILSRKRKNDSTSNPYLNWAHNLVKSL